MNIRKSGFMTETLGCDPSEPSAPAAVQETVFDLRRGISKVEVRDGYAQAHIFDLSDPIVTSRIAVLDAIAKAKISIDFLKLTQDGLSFLVREEHSNLLAQTLNAIGVQHSVKPGQHILLVHAVNMRDEEGLIARVVNEAIASRVKVEHIGDMHDRMLMVVDATQSSPLKAHLESALSSARVGAQN